MKLDNYCILCRDQTNLQNNSIKVWLVLFKNGNNFMNIENCEASEPHRFRLDFTNKINLDLQKHGFSQCDT